MLAPTSPMRRSLRWLAGGFLPLAAWSAAAQGSLPPSVAGALQRAGLPASAVSAVVVPVAPEGPERLRHRADVPVNPASVMKLVTTYAAIDLLGPDFTWNTRFYTDGTIRQGVLRGN